MDKDSLSVDLLRDMYAMMQRIRVFEEQIGDCVTSREVRTPCHLYIGEEAIATGVCFALEATDTIWGAHRSHGHYLAKGGDLQAIASEILGRTTGCARGRGGSMHILSAAHGLLGTVPIVAGTIPLAVGAGFAAKLKRNGGVAISFFGDGATEEGHFHESSNMAALYKLPVVFVCENNLYSSHMHMVERRPRDNLNEMGPIYDMPGLRIDGNDVTEVYTAATEAVARARNGEGPSLIECRTYRWRGHVGPAWDEDVGVKRKDELQEWVARCPIKRLGEHLMARGVPEAALAEAAEAARTAVVAAIAQARRDPYPEEAELLDHVFVQKEAK